MNTIVLSEESAIIPLSRLNEMKANEDVFRQKLNDNNIAIFELSRYSGDPSRTYFIDKYNEGVQAMANKLESQKRESRETIALLKSEKEVMERKILALSKKKWYQFMLINS